MAGSGFNVVAEDLRSAATSVGAAVDAVAGFTMETSGGDAYGHDALNSAVQDMCSTIPQVIQTFGLDAAAAGEALGVAARAYTDADANVAETLGSTSGDN